MAYLLIFSRVLREKIIGDLFEIMCPIIFATKDVVFRTTFFGEKLGVVSLVASESLLSQKVVTT